MVKRLFIATIVAISPLLAFAQNVISGHISDVRTGEPLIGATVIVKNEKSQGVVTDYDGNFTLQTKVQAPLTLRVEYVGYRPLDVDVYDFEEPVQIALADNSNSLNEVVVVGYGVQKRKSLTGSVTTVKNEKLLQTSTSLDNALANGVFHFDRSKGFFGLFMQGRYDNLDNAYFATRGLYLDVDGSWHKDNHDLFLQSDSSFVSVRASVQTFLSPSSRFTFIPQAHVRLLVGNGSSWYTNFVGGTLPGRFLDQLFLRRVVHRLLIVLLDHGLLEIHRDCSFHPSVKTRREWLYSKACLHEHWLCLLISSRYDIQHFRYPRYRRPLY